MGDHHTPEGVAIEAQSHPHTLLHNEVRARINRSGEVVGEVPSTQLARLQADEQVVACNLCVPFTLFAAEVTRGYPEDDRTVFQHAEARFRAKLDAAVGWSIFTNDDAGALVSP
jgi:hypothetical protein